MDTCAPVTQNVTNIWQNVKTKRKDFGTKRKHCNIVQKLARFVSTDWSAGRGGSYKRYWNTDVLPVVQNVANIWQNVKTNT